MEWALRTAGFLPGKVFRPLLSWFILSFLLLVWHNHEKQERRAAIQFTVSIEGRTDEPRYRSELDGVSFRAGAHSGLGSKELTVQADDAEVFVTNLFVWYGGKNLRNIVLTRTRGALDLSITPSALRLVITNQEVNRSRTNISRDQITLPTGTYAIKAEFARLTVEREVEISPHSTTRLSIDPGITTLRLRSEPTNAEFALTSAAPINISIRSNTPALLTEMPSGEYQLRIWRGDYEKTVSLNLKANPDTNEYEIVFDYAKVAVKSEPSDAQIREGEKLLGTTPATLEIPSGTHRFRITKEGFRGTNLFLELSGNESRAVAVVLPNATYADALDRAREYLSASAFLRALEQVDKALEVKQGDEAALALHRTIEFNHHLQNAKEYGSAAKYTLALAEVEAALRLDHDDATALALKNSLAKSKLEAEKATAEARRNRPRQTLENIARPMQYSSLFPIETIQFTGSVETARAAVTRAFARKPEYSILKQEKPDEDVTTFHAEFRSIGTRHNVVLVAGQTTANEVTICFKLFQLTLDTKLGLSVTGWSDDSYKPLHAQHLSAFRAPFAERQRTNDLQTFRKRIEDELR